jgi:hypothetical protein
VLYLPVHSLFSCHCSPYILYSFKIYYNYNYCNFPNFLDPEAYLILWSVVRLVPESHCQQNQGNALLFVFKILLNWNIKLDNFFNFSPIYMLSSINNRYICACFLVQY